MRRLCDVTNEMGDDTIADNAHEPDEVARFLIALRALGEAPAPAPTQAVAALIGGAVPLRRHRHHRAAVRAAIVAAAVLAALVGAAANHSLPQPAQRVVSNVVNDLTPFDIGPGPAAPPATPSHTRKPDPDRSRGEDEPTRTDEPSEQRGETDDNTSPGPTRGDDGAAGSAGPPEPDSPDGNRTGTSAPEPTAEPSDRSTGQHESRDR